jgi:hypothetical protein
MRLAGNGIADPDYESQGRVSRPSDTSLRLWAAHRARTFWRFALMTVKCERAGPRDPPKMPPGFVVTLDDKGPRK